MIAVMLHLPIAPVIALILLNGMLAAIQLWLIRRNRQQIPAMVRRLEESVELLEEGKTLLERMEGDLSMARTERDAYAKLIAQSNVRVELTWTELSATERRLDVHIYPKEPPLVPIKTDVVH